MSFASPSTSTPPPHPVLTLLLALEGVWLRKTTLLGDIRLLDNWHPIEIERPWCWERLKAGGEGMTGDVIVGWHYWLNGHEFEQAPGVIDGQGSLACCSMWGCKELDMKTSIQVTELNWTERLKEGEICSLQGDFGLALSLVICYCF